MKSNCFQRRAFYRWLRVVVALWGFAAFAFGEDLFGRVTAVQDDETIVVSTMARVEFRVRLAAVTPLGPSGSCAKRLSQMILNRSVKVTWERRDRRRRLVGKVLVGMTDVGLLLISEGLATHATTARREQSAVDWNAYEEAQARVMRKQ